MNRLMLFKGRAMACLILMCLFLAQGCRKDLLTPQSSLLGKQISIEEAKQFFEQSQLKLESDRKISSTGSVKPGAKIPTKISDAKMPMWDGAQLKDLAIGKNAVITPLHSPGLYVNVSEKRMVKYGFLNYLMMYKDSENKIITEWVELKPSEKWLGSKVTRKYDGMILIRNWDGSIKRRYSFTDGAPVKNNPLKKTLLATAGGAKMTSPNGGEVICFVTTRTKITVNPPRNCVCENHAYGVPCTCIYGRATQGSTTITQDVTIDCDPTDDPEEPGTGGGGGNTGETGSPNPGGGGSPNPSDYTPISCNPDPDYVMPTIPPPPGTEYILPCSAIEIPVETEPTIPPGGGPVAEVKAPNEILVDWFNSDVNANLHLSAAEITYLQDNPLIANELFTHLASETLDTKSFGKWAIGYLTTHPQGFDQEFRDMLNDVRNDILPINLPADFDINYPQEYYDTEDSYDALTLELMQAGVNNTDPIPEAYYKYGTRIDMAGATPLNGRTTALGFPSNHRYFWKEMVRLRPEMFDEANRTRILTGGSPVANDRWIKYNPSHKAYKDLPLRHHHEGQGRWAYAIPEKVHQKWSKILHSIKIGKFPKLRGTMNSLAGGMQIFSLLTDFTTGNPDAWLNWYGSVDEVGKVYKQPLTGDYFVITKQTKYMNSSGEVIRAKVTYDVYADYIWDEDEKKYMGVLKLGTFTEDIDMNNRWSTNSVWEPKML